MFRKGDAQSLSVAISSGINTGRSGTLTGLLCLGKGSIWPSSRNYCIILGTVPCVSGGKSGYVPLRSSATSTWVRRLSPIASIIRISIRTVSVTCENIQCALK